MGKPPLLRVGLLFAAVMLFAAPRSSADEFLPTDSLSQVRQFASSVKLNDGRVLVLGGGDANGNCSASVEAYDPAADAFLPVGNMKAPRKLHKSVLLNDGRVLIMGGYCGFMSYTSSAEIFNPADNTFTLTGSMQQGRARFTATTMNDGRVLVTGGAGMNGSNDAEIYDPDYGAFHPASWGMSYPVKDHTATLLPSGEVLVAGGWNNGTVTASNQIELFDPATETFKSGGTLLQERAGHTATLLADGKTVLFTGGFNFRTGSNYPIRSAEVISLPLFTQAVTGSLNIARQSHSAALMADGRLLLTGGGTFNNDTQTSEVYDPLLKRFTLSARQLADRRYEHVSVPLDDGRVLIAGDTSILAELFVADVTPPVTTITLDGDRHSSGWFTSPVTATLTATDGTGTGVAKSEYRFDYVAPWQSYSGPFSLNSQGHNIVLYRSADKSGHIEKDKEASVPIDLTSPATSISLSGTLGDGGWYRSAVQVFLPSTDGAGSGVKQTLYSTDGAIPHTPYTGSFAIANEGTTSLSVFSEDIVGHQESPKSTEVKIDTIAPTTTIALSGNPGENGWYVSPVTVTLTATDSASGVARTEYSFDNVTWSPYSGALTMAAEGYNIIVGRSTDAAGNVAAVTSATFRADTKAPVITGTTPAPALTGVPLDQTIGAFFSEPAREGASFTGISVTTVNRKGVVTTIPTVNRIVGSTLTIDPVANLAGSTAYTVTIPAGALKDEAGNPLSASKSFGFTTRKR